jgi:nitrogen regulatory protein PII
MKAVFIVYNQAYGDEIIAAVEALGQRGFTRFDGVGGRGSQSGIPHLDSHAWPEYNDALMLLVEDEKAAPVLEALRAKDAATPELGLKAFSWKIDEVL